MTRVGNFPILLPLALAIIVAALLVAQSVSTFIYAVAPLGYATAATLLLSALIYFVAKKSIKVRLVVERLSIASKLTDELRTMGFDAKPQASVGRMRYADVLVEFPDKILAFEVKVGNSDKKLSNVDLTSVADGWAVEVDNKPVLPVIVTNLDVPNSLNLQIPVLQINDSDIRDRLWQLARTGLPSSRVARRESDENFSGRVLAGVLELNSVIGAALAIAITWFLLSDAFADFTHEVSRQIEESVRTLFGDP